MKDETIKICSDHLEYETPLIWTFAFNGAEFWCPFCGKSEGMLGAGMDVELTNELVHRLNLYKQKTDEYLDAVGTETCSSLIFEGRRVSPHDLPQREKDRITEVIKTGWVLYSKIESVAKLNS